MARRRVMTVVKSWIHRNFYYFAADSVLRSQEKEMLKYTSTVRLHHDEHYITLQVWPFHTSKSPRDWLILSMR